MRQKVKTTAKTKNIQVFVGLQLLAETNSDKELNEVIFSLNQDQCPEFKVVWHRTKISRLYKKDRYDKNYRITAAEYVAPSQVVAEEEATE